MSYIYIIINIGLIFTVQLTYPTHLKHHCDNRAHSRNSTLSDGLKKFIYYIHIHYYHYSNFGNLTICMFNSRVFLPKRGVLLECFWHLGLLWATPSSMSSLTRPESR